MTQTTTGARAVFMLDNNKVAYANATTYTVTHVHQPVDVMGKLAPEEYAETGYTVNFTCTMFRVPGTGTTGVVGADGKLTAGKLRPKFEDILRQPELSVQLYDTITGKLMWAISRVKCTQEDFNIDARNIGQLTLSFVGIAQIDETSVG